MNKRIADAILEAFTAGRSYISSDLPDDAHCKLLCRFKLGDLRELERIRKDAMILSGSGVPGDEA